MKTGLPASNGGKRFHPGGDLGLFSELHMHVLSSLLDIATQMDQKSYLKLNMPKIEYVGSPQHVLNMVLFTCSPSFLYDTIMCVVA